MVTGVSSNISVSQLTRQRRKARRPSHSFYLKQVPYTIQPFMLAPVLPGETLENLLLQSRAVTDPIKNGLIGWWLEYYLFYVKLRDLDDRDTYAALFIDPDTSLAGLVETDDTVTQYFNPGTTSEMNWTERCLKRVTEEYFRAVDETWNNITISSLPVAAVVGNSYLDSFINDDAFQTAIEPTIDTTGASVGISVIEQAMRQWELLRLDNMTQLTFEDYCRTYGVNIAKEDPHKPELLRFVREWQYPSNTVDPATGAPSSAVSWAVAERADKKRFFTEPGFIFGVTVCRPKIYFGNLRAPAASVMDRVQRWLPALMNDDINSSLVERTAGTLPANQNTDDYWLDIKDLFLYGDQFVNYDQAADLTTNTGVNSLALPTAGGVWKYPTNQAMLDRLFVSANAVIKQDGICNLNIMGRLENTT